MLRIFLIFLFAPMLASAEALVLEYTFTSDKGVFVTDTSGNGLDGTILGSGTKHFGSGFSGRGLKLNGIDDYVLVPDDPLFDLDQYTLMAWVKFKPNLWDREEVIEKNGAFWMNIRQDTQRVRVGGFFGGCGDTMYYHKFDSTGIVPIDTWTHVAATYNGSLLKIYINGVLSGKSAVPVPGPVCVNIEPLSVGAKHATLPPPKDVAYLFGKMDSIRIFDSALPGWRIKQEMIK